MVASVQTSAGVGKLGGIYAGSRREIWGL
uniref:Uncharacterized protein n=1 Tax=Arundo donax TaxID=35708 RepID=A0A0A9A8Q0_ARUDO